MRSVDHYAVLDALGRQGLLDSRSLQVITGKSQATISRLLSDLAGEVMVVGRGRATKYAIRKSIHNQSSYQPLYWTSEAGVTRQLGLLHYLGPDNVYVDTPAFAGVASGMLPWYLSPLRVDGFLGRLHARNLAAYGLGPDPQAWTLEDTLYSALHLWDPPGAVRLGDVSQAASLPLLPQDGTLSSCLDRLADNVARHLPAGSSAAGEQPKFLARFDDGRQVLVKFSPPSGTPFGQRWHDLLYAEALAGQVLTDYGIDAAMARVVHSAQRTYLLSDRFDRIGGKGRRHVVAIGAVHRGLVGGRYTHWADTAQALAQRKRLSARDADRVRAILQFGRLIGNTDMHGGNLSLVVTPDTVSKGVLTLAPVYDMLPMCWRPVPALTDMSGYTPFEPDDRQLGGPMAGLAHAYWCRLGEHPSVSDAMRQVAREMAARM